MAISVVRLGNPRAANEGPRLGTVRRPPRGVKKEDFGKRDFYDVWLPDLAPTQELLSWALEEPLTGARWTSFAKKYRAEMKKYYYDPSRYKTYLDQLGIKYPTVKK